MNKKLIAKRLLRIAKTLTAEKDYEYISDPNHENEPKGRNWERTKKGWGKWNAYWTGKLEKRFGKYVVQTLGHPELGIYDIVDTEKHLVVNDGFDFADRLREGKDRDLMKAYKYWHSIMPLYHGNGYYRNISDAEIDILKKYE